ncbi:MAG: hypothetical protein ABI968_00205 [Acidobacteriota bacterium]
MSKPNRLRRVILAALCALSAPLSAANLTYFRTVPNTDFAVFGAGGMRGQGTGSIVVSGISGTVTGAFLFWHGPTDDSGDRNAGATFGGSSILGLNIGLSGDNGWSLDHSVAYRADVTGLVAGNGTYSLANFRKPGPRLADINGVSLLIFFDDGNPSNNRDVVVFNGNHSNKINYFDADNWSVALPGITYAGGPVNMLLVVSDGQAWNDDELKINGSTFLASGELGWQGSTVPDQGKASTTNGGLWDQRSFDVTSLMSPGLNTLQIQPTTYVDDQVSLIAVLFDLPVGAAPFLPTPTAQTPTPTPSWTLTPTPTPTRTPGLSKRTPSPTPTPNPGL